MGITTVVQIPFQGGLDEKTSPEYLDPTQKLQTCVNGNFNKIGAVDKRLGIGAPTQSQLSPSGSRITSWSRSSLTAVAPGKLYTFAPALANTFGGLTTVGALPAVKAIRRAITTPSVSFVPSIVDFPYNGSLLRVVVSYDSLDNMVGTVVDANTGDVVLDQALVFVNPGGTLPTLVFQMFALQHTTAANSVVITVYNPNTGELFGSHYDPTINSFTAPTLLVTQAGVQLMEATPWNLDPSGRFFVLYASSTTQLVLTCFNPDLSISSTRNLTPIGGGSTLDNFNAAVVATFGGQENIWILYRALAGSTRLHYLDVYSGDGSFVHITDQQLLFTKSTDYYYGGACRAQADKLFFTLWNIGSTGLINTSFGGAWEVIDTVGNLVGGTMPMGFLPKHQPFKASDGSIYQVCWFTLYVPSSTDPSSPHSQQTSIYLMKYTDITQNDGGVNKVYPVATVAPRETEIGQTNLLLLFTSGRIPLNSVATQEQSRYAIPLKTVGLDIAASGGDLGPSWTTDFYFDDASIQTQYQMNEIGQELHISGGVPFIFDSALPFEDGFFYFPEFMHVSQSGSGNTLTGTYTYAVCYSYNDAAGLVHRSAAYIAPPITLSGGQFASVNIPSLSVTYRDQKLPGNVFADVFRTTSNGSILYFLGRIPISGTFDPYVVFGPDGEVDEQLAVASILYTTGNVLQNVNPPSSTLQSLHQGRVAIVDETLRTVWFSQEFSEGEAPGWSGVLTVPFPEGGDITAISGLDDAFVVFKHGQIWIQFGDGPGATGSNSNWTTPQKIASDVGCVDYRSVVLTDVGLFFQSEKGIYLLSRGRQVTYIGKNVQDTLALFPTITSAVLVPKSNQVKFTCTDGQSSIVIVYDYLLGQWMTHVYPYLTTPIASACMSASQSPNGPQYSLLTTDGNLWQEKLPSADDAYLDDSINPKIQHFVSTSVTSGWVRTQGVADLQGYQRTRKVTLLAQRDSDCDLKMELSVNYDPTIQQTALWPSNVLNRFATDQVEVHVGARLNKSQAIQVTVSDQAPSVGDPTTGKGCRFIGVSFELDAIGPRYRKVPVALRR